MTASHKDNDIYAPYRALWLAVIDQVLHDAGKKIRCKFERSIQEEQQKKRDALSWIDSEDFRMVCSLGGIDPSYLSERIPELLRDRSGRIHKICRSKKGSGKRKLQAMGEMDYE